ncbi:hypothetical protein I3843_05G109700 [Carya illinoinensis]|nr:hypothetical protein I3760_05G121500 [Carya illinoinensis]KAG7979024.1 hypothetical protein I3843_05G109700 [Carya illinoinensis]
MGDKGKFELENRNEDPINYASSVSDWGFGGANLTNTSIGLVPKVNPMAVSKGGLIGSSSCSSTSMVDAFGPTIWDHHANSENLGFCDNGVQKNASTSDTFGIRKGDPVALRSIDKTFDMVWNPTSSMLKGDIFLPNSHAMLPQRLTPFPADSAFIERAARFSCFNGGNFSDMFNPFAVPESMGLYSGAGGVMQGTQEAFAGSGLKSVSGGQSQKNEPSVGEVSKDVSLSVEHGAAGGSPPKDERSQSHVRSHEESKQRSGGSGNDSDEAELSGAGDQDEPSVLEGAGREPFARGLDSRKRKRNGQATNSHSLAERVRREKISERMKFLQDLVPGCSKVTGKAVMLDEIINYVQSLQRQVEFLSMKLATVNPRLDFNVEGLLAKDILPSRVATSSTLGFSPDMPMAYPPLHPSQRGLIQAGLPGMGSSSDLLQRTIHSQLTPMAGGFKEPTQLPNVWDDELHNVIQMSYGTSAPSNTQDEDGSLPSGQMKVEL